MITSEFVRKEGSRFMGKLLVRYPGALRLCTRQDLMNPFVELTTRKLNQLDIHFAMIGKRGISPAQCIRFVEDMAELHCRTVLNKVGDKASKAFVTVERDATDEQIKDELKRDE